jgi:hypothetical protein
MWNGNCKMAGTSPKTIPYGMDGIHMESAKFDGFHMESMWNVGAQ